MADRFTSTGKTVNHQFAKELLAGIAGGEVDKLCETKGADYIDRERAKRDASKRAEDMYDQHYGKHMPSTLLSLYQSLIILVLQASTTPTSNSHTRTSRTRSRATTTGRCFEHRQHNVPRGRKGLC